MMLKIVKKLEIDICDYTLDDLNNLYEYYDREIEFDFSRGKAIIATIEYKGD